MKEIELLADGKPATAFETDGDKYVRVRFADGSTLRLKAVGCVAYHIRKYDHEFSRKLLKGLPKNPEFWGKQ
jgi:hypothetical protein